MGWTHIRHNLHAVRSSLTQLAQDRPFIGHNDLCKRSRASSWFCTLVLVLAAAPREKCCIAPACLPGAEEHMR